MKPKRFDELVVQIVDRAIERAAEERRQKELAKAFVHTDLTDKPRDFGVN